MLSSYIITPSGKDIFVTYPISHRYNFADKKRYKLASEDVIEKVLTKYCTNEGIQIPDSWDDKTIHDLWHDMPVNIFYAYVSIAGFICCGDDTQTGEAFIRLNDWDDVNDHQLEPILNRAHFARNGILVEMYDFNGKITYFEKLTYEELVEKL